LQPLIIIVGPTAVGKSSLGVELALSLGGEIISGDSVQVYRGLNVGSAKLSTAERKGIPHHLVDILDPDEPFTVADFQRLAQNLINDIKARNKVPIIVGGTGLYIRSILDDFSFPQEGAAEIKKKWLAFVREAGQAELYLRLKQCDPLSAQKLHPNDTARIIRALEVFELTGKPLSQQRAYGEKEYGDLDKTIIYLGLTAPREIIYERINNRCEYMVKYGIIEEVSAILNQGYSPSLKPLQSIGYRHTVQYLRGLTTREEMLRLLKRDTRRFAKRQLTWFRRDPRLKWYDITKDTFAEIIADVLRETRNTCTVF